MLLSEYLKVKSSIKMKLMNSFLQVTVLVIPWTHFVSKTRNMRNDEI